MPESQPANQPEMHVAPLAQIKPWSRYWARTIDSVIFSIPFLIFMGIWGAVTTLAGVIVPNVLEFILEAVLYWLWVPVEALVLSITGTTVGKWLFGIEVKPPNHQERLTFFQALSRAWQVNLIGDWLSIFPLLITIANLKAYNRLQKTGSTAWDENVGTTILYHDVPLWKSLLGFVAVLFVIGLVIGLAVIAKMAEG